MPARIRTDPLDPGTLLARVASIRHGATALFVGTVRDVNDGRAVAGLEYSAYLEMAERELGDILAEAEARFGASIAAEHRIGALALGDASVVVAASAPHRGEAFDACRYVLEELKQRVPVWKREHYIDGSREWVGASSAGGAGTVAPREG